ncbi:MAG: nucleotidyltransferase domain-containing protein [Lachnospiraceae bacterium]|nr:nucleotidyltransferase domain-containing protein [Lachnospiraceae bacterium]
MKEDILKKLRQLNMKSNYRMGLAGSISRGCETDNSDIDIVVDTNDMPISDMNVIKDLLKEYNRNVDVLCLGLLKDEDEELDNFMKENDLPVNDESVYKTIMKEVIWVA